MPSAPTPSNTKTFLKIAFDRYTNAALILTVLGLLWYFLPFYLALVIFIGLVIFFVVGVAPTARRNKAAWDGYFPRLSPSEKVNFVNHNGWREWQRPLLLVVHSQRAFSVSTLANFNHEAFDNACICVSLPHRVFPLARYVLWKLGGILPASRAVLLRLLGRTSSAAQKVGANTIAPPSVVVVYYDGKQITANPAENSFEAQLTSKSVISAALKTGSAVAPAVQLQDGSIFVGKPFQLSPNAKNNNNGNAAAASSSSSTGIETPSLEQVLESSEQYCNELKTVMQKAYGPNVNVVAKR